MIFGQWKPLGVLGATFFFGFAATLANASQAEPALQEVSLTLQRGECLGVIGDNGAGKSTLLKLLAGTLQPSTGSLLRQGRDMNFDQMLELSAAMQALAHLTDDHIEGVTAVLEKRAGEFTGN